MAASLKKKQIMKLNYTVDRKIYDTFVKVCGRKGLAPRSVVEKLMNKYNETGQI